MGNHSSSRKHMALSPGDSHDRALSSGERCALLPDLWKVQSPRHDPSNHRNMYHVYRQRGLEEREPVLFRSEQPRRELLLLVSTHLKT